MLTNLMPKNADKFICNVCDFKCSKLSNYNTHILTNKHKILTNVDKENDTKVSKFKCECGKEYNHRQSLSIHKKKCHNNFSVVKEKHDTNKVEGASDKDLIMLLIKENSDFKTMLMEQSNIMMEVIKNGATQNSHNTTHTNSHNKAFNLNFFLNETCKDAMNIMDFVDSIKLQLSDLEKVGQIGYVEGISNIIVKNLNDLDVTERPIHCTDKKRETLYVKDEDKWEKEDEEKKKIKNVIKKVANKNIRLLQKFKEVHPDCGKSTSKFSDQYNKIIVESMGGSGDNDSEKEEKIIQKISKNVTIYKN